MTTPMLWIGMGLTLIVAIVLMTVARVKGCLEELGSVSVNWLAEHRVDLP